MAHQLLARFRTAQVIPVVRTRTAQSAAVAVGWLRDAGVRIFEITMTVPDATALIRDLASDRSFWWAREPCRTRRWRRPASRPARNSSSRPGSIQPSPHPAEMPEPPSCWAP